MEEWHPEELYLHETMYEAANAMIGEAQHSDIPLWDLREQFLKVFDEVAEAQ